jgi:hypothetical protein
VIGELVAPVLHAKEPVALVDNTLLPQLFTMVTAGADGIAFGDAVPEPATLEQPFTV